MKKEKDKEREHSYRFNPQATSGRGKKQFRIYRNKQGEYYYTETSNSQDEFIDDAVSIDSAFSRVQKLNEGK